ncbi:preprotein translocase subunit SecY [Mangrovivirga sp. M17]|uniref:Protein translocase subunit SecY n=1 Tax=Mangrovivirga halotolerans TaxID=2993936 RepID=A0ABT3RT95_9BACT|nr:preprotein translocase subunit SecY [Mangrovivirga halotolerans]MCX2745022.1 preprotein translocase subunit SecY [Mangrovivirga halotolerans]
MKKFITTIRNIFSIEELRTRILNTLGFLIIFRLGSFIVLPGVDPDRLPESAEGIFGLLDSFLGGAFNNAAIFGLGIMPYISASIVVQLLTIAIPHFQRLQKEGESGRKRLTQITRVLTIIITLGQSIGYLTAYIPGEAVVVDPLFFKISSAIILTSGTMFCMWLGERITDKGIGNGISMLIMIGIISRFPSSLIFEFSSKGDQGGIILFVLEMVALFFVVMAVVALTKAVRRIPVNYAKAHVSGGRAYGGQRQYIPLKVNSSGVMPIIFAQALMFLPALFAQPFQDTDLGNYFITTFSNYQTPVYNITFAILIILFTFFYTAITVNPTEIADGLKRNGGFIPGVKPGKETSEYLDSVLTKITLPGSIFLAIVAILPAFATLAGVSPQFSQFYGGTSLLIMVGVILDTLQQIESYLLMRHYEGLMKSGKVKGRSEAAVV